jgi:hypothetical protein
MILSYDVGDEKIILFFALPGNSIPHLVHLSGRRRTTAHEKEYSQSGEIPEKTTNNILCDNVFLKLCSGVWSNHCMSPQQFKLFMRARRGY